VGSRLDSSGDSVAILNLEQLPSLLNDVSDIILIKKSKFSQL